MVEMESDMIGSHTINNENEVERFQNINLEEESDADDDMRLQFNPDFSLFAFNKTHRNTKTDKNHDQYLKKTLKSYDNEYKIDHKIEELAEKHIKNWNKLSNESSSLKNNDIFEEKPIPKIQKLKKPTKKNIDMNTTIIDDRIDPTSLKYFDEFGLSKLLIKTINEAEFIHCTPIQSAAIPHILNGRDLFGCAKTGSGKTAAYVIPIIERMIRIKSTNYTRVLIILPTRELALQIFNVFKDFSKYTSITCTLATGGQLNKVQESQLRNLPDVIIATPGRLIDHLHNCPSFNLKDIEILVLDEADRLLDENFTDQLEEIIKLASKTRQTLLFSATMNNQVEKLGNISLKNPIKLFVDSNISTVHSLKQEFIKLKEIEEPFRLVYICSLVCRNFNKACLIFCETKRQAHRLRIILGLLGQKVTELHGDLSQLQRYEALNNFKDGNVDIMVATNLAARGLDIEGIETVVNVVAPSNIQDYIHRVGRTARAGKCGRSITIIGEQDKKLLKIIAKSTPSKLQLRNIPYEIIEKFKEFLKNMENDIESILRQEKENRELTSAENEISRAKNKMIHDKEIKLRPKRKFINKTTTTTQSLKNKKINNNTPKPKIHDSATYKNIKQIKRSQKKKSLKQEPQNVDGVGKKLSHKNKSTKKNHKQIKPR